MPGRKSVKLLTIPKNQSETLEEFTQRAEEEVNDAYTSLLVTDSSMVPPVITFLPDRDFGIIVCTSFALTS